MKVTEIALAALLHDIGKFSQRAFPSGEGLSPQSEAMKTLICPVAKAGHHTHLHVLYTNEFIETLPYLPPEFDKSFIANLATFHHRPETPEQELIARADRLSSGMERLDDAEGGARGAFRRVRMHSVATTISLAGTGESRPAFLPLAKLAPEEAYPMEGESEELLTPEYFALWTQFWKEWKENRCSKPLGFINRALSVIERYTWCIPSAANVVPDISLFDHSKTTAAIASCLFWPETENDKPFLLVAGDLTGIQKYIYGIRQGAGGLARRLRARSFKVDVYLVLVSLAILERLGLPLTQRLICAGGKFHLLLPNAAETRSTLNDVRKEVAQWLFSESSGEVGFALGEVACGEDDLRHFSDTVTEVNQRLRDARSRSAEMILIEGGEWQESRFVLPPLDVSERVGICDCCGKRAGPEKEVKNRVVFLCESCEGDERLGRELPRSQFLHIDFSGSAPFKGPIGGFNISRTSGSLGRDSILVVDLDGSGQGNEEEPLFGVFQARHIPRDPEEGEALSFEDIAKASQGRAALGVLKMDVDNLGYIFSRGFRGNEEGMQPGMDHELGAVDRTSISRVNALSRTLETFFSGYVGSLLVKEFRSVYLIYSGGDDLAAVGPWDLMFDFAQRIREEFRRFTGCNPNWSLSGGLAVVQSHLPILSAIEECEILLEVSKTARGEGILPCPLPPTVEGPAKKDRFTAFRTSMPWDRYSGAIQRAKRLHGWIQSADVSTGQVRRLMAYSHMQRRFEMTGDTRHLQYVPLMTRDIRRNWPDKTEGQREAREWAASLCLPDSEEMKALLFTCEYALYTIRGPE